MHAPCIVLKQGPAFGAVGLLHEAPISPRPPPRKNCRYRQRPKTRYEVCRVSTSSVALSATSDWAPRATNLLIYGGPCRARTYDLLIKSSNYQSLTGVYRVLPSFKYP